MKHKTLVRPLQIKEVSEEGRFSGYGSVFNNVDHHKDVIMPGAFSKTLERHKDRGTMPAMLWQHSMRDVVGIYDDMKEDDRGLFMEGRLLVKSNIPEADKAYSLMKHKAVSGMSIGFNIPKGGESFNKEDEVWEIKEVDLVEVSIVTYPANPEAQIQSVKHALENPREFERLLRDAGLSALQAKRLMSAGYDAMLKRDAEASDEEDQALITQMIKTIGASR